MKWISIMIGFCLIMMIAGCKNDSRNYTETTSMVEEQIQSIEVYGEVVVEETKGIAIDFPALVEKIYIKEGQKVKEGDPLIQLSFEDYNASIEMKTNEINIYEAQLKQLKEMINPIGLEVERITQELAVKRNHLETNTDPDIQILQRSLEIANQEAEDANKEYVKNKELFDIGAISEQELKSYEQAITIKEKEKKDTITKIDQLKTNKQLEITALTTQLKSNERQLSNTDKNQAASIEEISLKIKTAKLELEGMKSKINRSYIQDNIIIAEEDNLLVHDIACMVGSQISELSGAILKTMDLDTMIISIDIPEEYIGEVHIGNKVEIDLYGEQSRDIIGEIVRISDLAIEKNGEAIIQADVSIKEGVDELRPGMTLEAKIH